MVTDDDLDMVETDRLVACLKKRHDALLLVTVKDLDAAREERYCDWKGGLITALGLTKYAAIRVATGKC